MTENNLDLLLINKISTSALTTGKKKKKRKEEFANFSLLFPLTLISIGLLQ